MNNGTPLISQGERKQTKKYTREKSLFSLSRSIKGSTNAHKHHKAHIWKRSENMKIGVQFSLIDRVT